MTVKIIKEIKEVKGSEYLESFLNDVLSIDWLNSHKSFKEEKVIFERLLNALNLSVPVDLQFVSINEAENIIHQVSISNSKLWEKMMELPDQLFNEITNRVNIERLEQEINIISEYIFHEVYEKTYVLTKDFELIKHIILASVYYCTLLFLSKLSGRKDLEESLFSLINCGFIPIGIQENKVYLLYS